MKNLFILALLIGSSAVFQSTTLAQTECYIPDVQFKDCSNLPSTAIALTSAQNNSQLQANKVYYISTNSTANFPSNLDINGATVVICGTGTVTAGNINFIKGKIIISSTSRLRFTSQLHVNSTSALHNFGTLQVDGNISAQSVFTEGNGFFNHFGALTITNSFEVNSTIINKGSVTVTNNTNINGSGSICMGNTSSWTTANLQNNKTNAFMVPVGTACLHVSKQLTGNNAIATSNKLIFCKPNTLNASANLVGQASVRNNCVDCALPLATELLSADLKENNGALELTWSVSEQANISRYIIEKANEDAVFSTIQSIEVNTVKKDTKTYSKYITDYAIGQNYFRVSIVTKDNAITELFTKSINIDERFNLSIYPNPSSTDKGIIIQLAGKELKGELKVIDYSGRTIYIQQVEGLKNIHIPSFKQGNYLIEYYNGVTIYREKFTII